MGLTSVIRITPIEVDIMQSLPELDIKLLVPGCSNTSSPSVAMLSSEQLLVYLNIKNVSNEPLGRFKIDSNPEVASFNEDDIAFLMNLRENSEFTLPITLNAYTSSTDVKFIVAYSNSEGKISLNSEIIMSMEVKEGIAVVESCIEPLFEYPWFKTLKDINPSMSEKGNAFPGRFEDLGYNDNQFCVAKFRLRNNSKDSLTIHGQIKDSNETKVIIIAANDTATIDLVMPRLPAPTEKILNEIISIEWTSLVNSRRGNLSNFTFSTNDIEFARVAKLAMNLEIVPEGSYCSAQVNIATQLSIKGLSLYFYPMKVTQEGIKLIPHDLIIAGCLAVPLNDNEKKYQLKYMQISVGEFVMVIGIGNKNRIICWSHKLWNLAR